MRFGKEKFNTRIENKILNFAETKQKLGRRKLADVFNIGKTAAVTNIFKKSSLSNFPRRPKNADVQESANLLTVFYDWHQKCFPLVFNQKVFYLNKRV